MILNDLRLGSTHSITNAVGYSPWRAWDPVAEREDGKPGAQRVAVYACYDAHGGYDESDLLYLRELRTIAQVVILVADNEFSDEAYSALKSTGLCDHIIVGRHGEYDFGSYKRGFLWALENGLLDATDELIFCNDSCYAPVHPFPPIFREMSSTGCDFWGLCKSSEVREHVQSFFVVFRPNVFLSVAFKNFMVGIHRQPTVNEVVLEYEIGLSRLLEQKGYISLGYVKGPSPRERRISFGNHLNMSLYYPIWMMEHGFPLVKKKALNIPNYNQEGGLETLDVMMRFNPNLNATNLGLDEVELAGLKPIATTSYSLPQVVRMRLCNLWSRGRKKGVIGVLSVAKGRFIDRVTVSLARLRRLLFKK
ncbi:MAG: rhamnan synthesis F family protein [Akkermansia muciniphila]